MSERTNYPDREKRERLQSVSLSGDRFGYYEARSVILHTKTWAARWREAIETARSLERNLTMPQHTVAYSFGRLRALFLELALAESKSSASARIRWHGPIETARAFQCNLATPPEAVADQLDQVRALFLELPSIEASSNAEKGS